MAREKSYGQFCPISRAAEILAERWTPLVIRELLCGSTRFNDLQRGVPNMSSSLLSQRLKELEYADIISRQPRPDGGRGFEYHLTAAGKELLPVLESMGRWAQRWRREDLTAENRLDAGLLMWDVRRCVLANHFSENERNTICFEFANEPVARRRYWLVFVRGQADLCLKDPGFEVNLYVRANVKTLVEVWLGHITIAKATRNNHLKLDGTRAAVKEFTDWFSLSLFAPEGNELPGQGAP